MIEDNCEETERARPTVRGGPPPLVSKWHSVTIKKVNNGFIVEVGCKTFVSVRWQDVASALANYWTDPNEAERMYLKF